MFCHFDRPYGLPAPECQNPRLALWDAASGSGPGRLSDMLEDRTASPTIAVICSANVCRSPMAHAIFVSELQRRRLTVNVLGAGILDMEGMQAAPYSQVACEQYATPLPKLESVYYKTVDLQSAVRVFGMEERHLIILERDAEVPAARLSLLGEFDPQGRGAQIRDPMGGTLEQHLACYRQLRDCIVHYLNTTHDLA
jgi:protein-tyrosine phosphatase